MLITVIIVVKAPCLDVVLGQLGVGQQLHVAREQLHIVAGKLLQLEVHLAHLTITIHRKNNFLFHSLD